MTRPKIVVNVTEAIARRGAPTDTGTAFMAYAAATGSPAGEVVECLSATDALDAGVPAAVAAWVGDALAQGAPKVYIVRATAVDPAAVTGPEWDAALGAFSDTYGPGQVLIPGVTTSLAHAALLDHAAATSRCVLLDSERDAAAGALSTTAAALASAEGSERAGLIAPWVVLPVAGGATRDVPGSVVAAGLAARGDATRGHANNAPAGDQGIGAGVVRKALAVTVDYTDTEHDTLHDAGVSVIRNVRGTPTLYGWRSLSANPTFRQLNIGRMTMQLGVGIRAGAEAFLFRQIDGRGHLFAELEGFLRGYLQPLWVADALYGAEADDAYDVDVQSVNTPQTIAAGELRATVAVRLTPHVELVTIEVATSVAEGA